MRRPRLSVSGKLPTPVSSARRLLAGRRSRAAASQAPAAVLTRALVPDLVTPAPAADHPPAPTLTLSTQRPPSSPASAGSTRRQQSLFARRRAIPRASLARRARRVLAVAWVGVVFAVCGAVATVLSTFLLLRADHDSQVATVWPTAGNLASVLVVVASSMQVGVWTSAERAWAGRRDFRGHFWLSTSGAARWIGAGSAIVVAVAARHHQLVATQQDRAWWLVTFGAACAVVGAALAAIQRFRLDPRPIPARAQRRTSKR